MCGLIAIIPIKTDWLSQKEIKIFEELLWVGAVRGYNGTGMFSIKFDNNSQVTKKPGNPVNLFKHIEENKVSMWGKLIVGHNRATTRGKNIEEHTHPFKEKQITLVHNGTLYTHNKLGNQEVDSHAICNYLTTLKPDETQTLIDNLHGDYALIWYNEDTKKLYALRNDKRPLYIIRTPEFVALVSEKEMGTWIIKRNDIEILKIIEVEPFTLYTFSPKEQFTKLKFKEHKFPIQQQQFNYNHNNTHQKEDSNTLTVDCWYCVPSTLNSNMFSCSGTLASNHNIDVEFESKIDMTGETVEVSRLYNQKPNLIKGFITPDKKKPINLTEYKKNTPNSYLPITTKNGILITNDVLSIVWNAKCYKCKDDFEYNSNIILEPLINKNTNHRYGYKYVCSKCAAKSTRA